MRRRRVRLAAPCTGVDYSKLGADAKIDPLLESQFAAGRLYAAISSRPGQSGRADGYILEGKELEVSLNLSLAKIEFDQTFPSSTSGN